MFTSSTTFIPKELDNGKALPINLCAVLVNDNEEVGGDGEEPTVGCNGTNEWGAVYTKNKFPGAPIISSKVRLLGRARLNALLINNKVSNVCAPNGVDNCEKLCESFAKAFDIREGGKSVLPSSTGIIGWRLPVEELVGCASKCVIVSLVGRIVRNTRYSLLFNSTFRIIFDLTLYYTN